MRTQHSNTSWAFTNSKVLVQENLLCKMLRDKNTGGMSSGGGDEHTISFLPPISHFSSEAREGGRLGPISSRWAGPGRGHRREWPARLCPSGQRTQGQLAIIVITRE